MSAFESEGVQKALSFLCLAIFGRLIKGRFSKPMVAGVQKLILDGMLPCVIFKALCSIKLDASLLKWPLMGAVFVVAQLAASALCSSLVFPGDRLAAPRRSALAELGTSAPGLSAMVFVKEFLLRAAGGGGGGAAGGASALGLLKDPLNVSIVAGLACAVSGTAFADLAFVGKAMTALASAQTPVLFLLIGMKLKFEGATPAACVVLLAAVSVVGWSQMAKASEAGVAGYNLDFAFDIVGYSMPLTMLLQRLACLSDPAQATARAATVLPVAGAALFAVGFLAIKSSVQDPAAWEKKAD
ncbi:hypothetical protein JL721_7448 [Aureococcus anophagefferens]|nr:hypothetical protein JL721_7448 [Aureococcus anophagefferens]